jgi:hypothetical protein
MTKFVKSSMKFVVNCVNWFYDLNSYLNPL